MQDGAQVGPRGLCSNIVVVVAVLLAMAALQWSEIIDGGDIGAYEAADDTAPLPDYCLPEALGEFGEGLRNAIAVSGCVADKDQPAVTIAMNLSMSFVLLRPTDVIEWADAVRDFTDTHEFCRRQLLGTPAFVRAVSCATPYATTAKAVERLFLAVFHVIPRRAKGEDILPIQTNFAVPMSADAFRQALAAATTPSALTWVAYAAVTVVGIETDNAAVKRKDLFATDAVANALIGASAAATTSESVTRVFGLVLQVTMRAGGDDAKAAATRRRNVFATPAFVRMACRMVSVPLSQVALRVVFETISSITGPAELDPDQNTRLNTLATPEFVAAVCAIVPQATDPATIVEVFSAVLLVTRWAGDDADRRARQNIFATQQMADAFVVAAPRARTASAAYVVLGALYEIVHGNHNGRRCPIRAAVFAKAARSVVSTVRQYAVTPDSLDMVRDVQALFPE